MYIDLVDFSELGRLAERAGAAIMAIYSNDTLHGQVDIKADDSPLTLADKASHEVLMAGLSEAYPHIPVISEEGAQLDYADRKDLEYFFLVDPLDGTKEFIHRNGQFTVNIALIHHQRTVGGVIFVPCTQTLYVGCKGHLAYKRTADGEHPLRVFEGSRPIVGVRSKSHAAPEEEEVLARFDARDSISVGSSLKFCMVAEGKADVYYRHGPTMEWDTAAGQAIAEAAGAVVLQGAGPAPFSYNKESLLNGSFLCVRAELLS